MASNTRSDISFLGGTDFRGRSLVFGIKQADRLSHIYVVGKTGVGKSTLLETLIRQDILAGRGVAVLDPHGDVVERLRQGVPNSRLDDLMYFNVPDATQDLGFNPLESVSPGIRSLAASGLLEAFKKLWLDSWGPRLEHILRNVIFALLEMPGATLGDIPRLLEDAAYRRLVGKLVQNARVKRFWLEEYEGYPARLRAEAIAPIQNKVGAFLTDPTLHRILTVKQSSLRMRQIMDGGKILLVNLSKGKLGEDTAALLGALLVSRINLAALSRADVPESERRDFFCYLDEFQTFTSLTFVTMLSELRKYHVGVTLAHQYLAQLDEPVRDAILGNVGTLVVFRVGAADAKHFAQEFYPQFNATDFTNLPNHHVYLKLMIDGAMSQPFSAKTLTPNQAGMVT